MFADTDVILETSLGKFWSLQHIKNIYVNEKPKYITLFSHLNSLTNIDLFTCLNLALCTF